MNETKIKKNTTKKKQKFKTIVISFVVFLVIIAVVIALCVKCSNRGNTNNNGTSSTTSVNINDYINDEEYLKINAKDCTLYVGDMVKLTCSSNPVEYSMGVTWSSSDESILTIAYDGMVTAVKEGIAVVTATHGVMTSSIIVQVINEEETPDEDLPIYTPEIPTTTVSDELTEPTPPDVSGSENNTKPLENHTTEEITNPNETTTQKPEKETTKAEEPTTVKPTEPPTTELPTTEPPTTVKPTEPETIPIRDNIINTLPECGFSSYMEGTYVFKEDGNYLGQVIVGDDFTQLYVMTRTTHFDSKIKELLQTILPTGYNVAFNNFMNSQKDMTFSADGHRIRVIVSPKEGPNGEPNGGHSQLIIYH